MTQHVFKTEAEASEMIPPRSVEERIDLYNAVKTEWRAAQAAKLTEEPPLVARFNTWKQSGGLLMATTTTTKKNSKAAVKVGAPTLKQGEAMIELASARQGEALKSVAAAITVTGPFAVYNKSEAQGVADALLAEAKTASQYTTRLLLLAYAHVRKHNTTVVSPAPAPVVAQAFDALRAANLAFAVLAAPDSTLRFRVGDTELTASAVVAAYTTKAAKAAPVKAAKAAAPTPTKAAKAAPAKSAVPGAKSLKRDKVTPIPKGSSAKKKAAPKPAAKKKAS